MYMYKILVVFLAVFMIDKRCLGTSAPSYLAKAQEINAIRLSEEWPRLSVSSKLNRDCKEYARHLATLNIPDQTLYWTNEVDEFGNKDVIITDHIAYPSSDPKNTNYIESICEFVNESCALYWYSKGGLFFRNHLKFPSKIEQSLAGKYTAMLWKSSKKIGVGIALKNSANKNKRYIMVVRYAPPGNVPGQYKQNLPKFKLDLNETITNESAFVKNLYIPVLLLNLLTFIVM